MLQSYPPKNGELSRTPSNITSVCVEEVPRTNTDVTPASSPERSTVTPGTHRRASATAVTPSAFRSAAGITVEAAATWSAGCSSPVAVTTTVSLTTGGCWGPCRRCDHEGYREEKKHRTQHGNLPFPERDGRSPGSRITRNRSPSQAPSLATRAPSGSMSGPSPVTVAGPRRIHTGFPRHHPDSFPTL